MERRPLEEQSEPTQNDRMTPRKSGAARRAVLSKTLWSNSDAATVTDPQNVAVAKPPKFSSDRMETRLGRASRKLRQDETSNARGL